VHCTDYLCIIGAKNKPDSNNIELILVSIYLTSLVGKKEITCYSIENFKRKPYGKQKDEN